jgi:hypothetical protein
MLEQHVFCPSRCPSHIKRFMAGTSDNRYPASFNTRFPNHKLAISLWRGLIHTTAAPEMQFFEHAIRSTPAGWSLVWSSEFFVGMKERSFAVLQQSISSFDVDVQIVLVMRSPSRWALSSWTQHSKVINQGTTQQYFSRLSVKTFLSRNQRWTSELQIWRSTFPGNITTVWYDGVRSAGADMFDVVLGVAMKTSAKNVAAMNFKAIANPNVGVSDLLWDLLSIIERRLESHYCKGTSITRVKRLQRTRMMRMISNTTCGTSAFEAAARDFAFSVGDTDEPFATLSQRLLPLDALYYLNATATDAASPRITLYKDVQRLWKLPTIRQCLLKSEQNIKSSGLFTC